MLYEWAWALQELGKPDDADRLFERLRKEYPQSRFWADATCRLAQRACDAKDYDAGQVDGLIERERWRAEGPTRRSASMPCSSAARSPRPRAIGRRCAKSFEALVKEFPDSRRRLVAEFWIAESYYRQGDYKAAARPPFDRLAEQIKDQREPWMAMIPLRRAQVLVTAEPVDRRLCDRRQDRGGLSQLSSSSTRSTTCWADVWPIRPISRGHGRRTTG